MRMLVVPVTALVLAAAIGSSCQLESAGQAKSAAASQSELDKLLAPIALYPDSLLAQMLLSAGTPAKVSELSTWLGAAANASLKGTALQDAASLAGFEPSLVALTLFPQVVTYMASKLDWTTKLGKAFAADRKAVFASIQRLRAQAQSSGALKDTPQQDVETRTTESGENVIVIEPANPQIIYVPQYDPQVVYVPTTTQTVVVQDDDDDADAAVAGLIGFTAGIAIGAAFDNDYYYGPYGMHGGFHMYNDAWDDWYDHREDAREDWMDHREDLYEERGDQRRDVAEQRTERRSDTAEQRTDRQQNRQASGTAAQRSTTAQARSTTAQARSTTAQTRSTTAQTRSTTAQTGTASEVSRGYGGSAKQANVDRSGTRSDAFSGYSSGKSERAASARGQQSRGGSRQSGGGGRRR